MKKSFKRSIAVLLSVIMVACSMPFTALAAAGEYKPDIQLQFGTFWNASAGSPLNQENQYDYDYSLSGVYGPVVDYKNGALVLDADKYATWNESFENEEITEDYTLTEGDIFTLTVRLDNVDKISAFEAAISYSDAIAPLNDEDWGVENGVEGTLNASLYEGLNDGLLGNLSFVDAEKNVIVASAAANNIDYADVSSTAVTGLTNPATGETDYDFAGKAVIATFVFQVVSDAPISFGIYNGADDEDTTYGGAYYIADVNDGTDPEDYTTYEPADAAGSTEMTFLTKNENVTPSGYTVKFVDAKGDTISEEVYDEGAAVTIPELPKMTNTTTQHTTYAWDVEPSATATADATYTIVATTVDHDYTATEKIPATCNEKGTRTYTCKVCNYSFDAQDIAATGKHTPAAAVEENKIDATCAKSGSYDSVVYCNDCGTELSRTPVTIDPTAHNYGDWTYNGDAVYTTSSNYKDGTATRTCGACGATDTKTIPNTGLFRARTANAEFGSAVKICVGTRHAQANSFKEHYCKFIRADGQEFIVKSDDKTDHYDTSSNTMFKFGVNPQSLASDVKVIFYGVTEDDITVWGPEYTYNMVNNYILNQLNTSTNTYWKTLLVELMYFGYYNQLQSGWDLDHPLVDMIPAELKGLHDSSIPTDLQKTQNTKYEVVPGAIAWKSINLEYGDATKIRFISDVYTPNANTRAVVTVDGESAPFEYSYAEHPELFSVGSTGRCTFIFPDLPAKRLRSAVYVQMFEDTTPITNVFQYSAETYCYNNYTKDPSESTLATQLTNQLMRYANAAIAYFANL